MRGEPLYFPRDGFRIGEIGNTHGAAANLVFISRADAPLGGADGGSASLRFARGVEIAVERQNEAGLI